MICFRSYTWVGRSLNISTTCSRSDIGLGTIPKFCSLDLFWYSKKPTVICEQKTLNKQHYRFQLLNAGGSDQNLRKIIIREIVFLGYFNNELRAAQKSSSPEMRCLCNWFPYRAAAACFFSSLKAISKDAINPNTTENSLKAHTEVRTVPRRSRKTGEDMSCIKPLHPHTASLSECKSQESELKSHQKSANQEKARVCTHSYRLHGIINKININQEPLEDSPAPFHSASLGKRSFQGRCFPAVSRHAVPWSRGAAKGLVSSFPGTPAWSTALLVVGTTAGRCHGGTKSTIIILSLNLTDSFRDSKSPSVHTR